MNTQYHTTTTASQALPVAEELVDIPSEHITGEPERPTLNEFSLSDKSMEYLFKQFTSFFEYKRPGDGKYSDRGRYYTHGDVDGFTFEVDWGVYQFKVVRHYRWNDLLSSPDESFEVKEVWDTVYDCARPWQTKRMNDYAKRNNL